MSKLFAEPESDVIVLGSGAAALSAALRASAGGLSVTILEKTSVLGGTSAMSGAGIWIPANHYAAKAGYSDSPKEALTYLRSASPEGWHQQEDALWLAFVENAPAMLEFLEKQTPLRFELTREPDTMVERAGGKRIGRMLSPLPLPKSLAGPYARKLRRSTFPHLFTYQEAQDGDLFHKPVRATLGVAHRLIWRLCTGSLAQGSALIIGLLKGCTDRGCKFELNTRAVQLLTEGERVVGVKAECAGVAKSYRARRGVVIATGGFEWDEALREEYFPGPLDWIASPRSNEGDGQRLAAAVGAKLDRMDQVNISPSMPTRYEGHLHGIPVGYQGELHAIVVNRQGERFVSEYDFNIGEALDRRDPATGQPVHLPAWVIADRRLLTIGLPFWFYALKKRGWVVKAPTLAGLASRINVPANALETTVSRYNAFCREGKDLDFHRGESGWERFKVGAEGKALGVVDKSPFFAMPLNRSIMGTKGGARTNSQGQVLRADGSVIEGLYAAGLSMANPIGTRAVGAGTTIGPNLTWGYICGSALLCESSGDGAGRTKLS